MDRWFNASATSNGVPIKAVSAPVGRSVPRGRDSTMATSSVTHSRQAPITRLATKVGPMRRIPVSRARVGASRPMKPTVPKLPATAAVSPTASARQPNRSKGTRPPSARTAPSPIVNSDIDRRSSTKPASSGIPVQTSRHTGRQFCTASEPLIQTIRPDKSRGSQQHQNGRGGVKQQGYGQAGQ